MSRITVVGAGYVGLVTGACLAELGHQVECLDLDRRKVNLLRQGGVPFHEPGLPELLDRARSAGRIHFSADYASAIPGAEFVLIAVDTPAGAEGQADLAPLRACLTALAPLLTEGTVIVNKSTVPIGTGDLVSDILARRTPVSFSVVSNPEFLREGSAVRDFQHPDRLVVGSQDPAAARRVAELYGDASCPVLLTDVRTAEMIKYASNAFLATRISFINEIAAVCEHLGADVEEVAQGMGMDARIGSAFLNAGIGWGGSCFPKDVRALIHMAEASGSHPQLLRAVVDINRHQRVVIVQRLRRLLGRLEDADIALLGLAFKPNTDDLRNAPSLELVDLLHHEGCRIRAFDPVAMDRARTLAPTLDLRDSVYSAATGADAVVLVTEWSDFAQIDLARLRASMRTPVFIDGRNMFCPEVMRRHGFVYSAIGRGSSSNNDSVAAEPDLVVRGTGATLSSTRPVGAAV